MRKRLSGTEDVAEAVTRFRAQNAEEIARYEAAK
jgi:hypothetical protein